MIVLDASVVLKWIFSDEAGAIRALRVKDAHLCGEEVIAVPELLFYEIANALATKASIGEADIAENFSFFWDFKLERFELGAKEFQHGLSLSRKYKISLYDAAYIVLALSLKCQMLTADAKLYKKVKSLKMVELL